MQKETEESGDLLNLVCNQLRQKDKDKGKEENRKEEPVDKGEKTGKEEKEMEEGGDLLNLVLKWKQKQVLGAIGATGATGGIGDTGATEATGATGAGTSSMQVSNIQASAHKGF